jgi:diacylglycerol O-acyltransferase / wax synthase
VGFWVPCTGRLALGVSILSYAGSLRLGVAGDARVLDQVGGIDRVTALLEAELDRLRC